jgi:hypothetical protein
MKNSHIKNAVVASLMLVSFGAIAQTNEIYRYKDKDGNIIYTDKLPKNKSEVGILSKKTGVLKNYTELEANRQAQQMTEEEKEKLAQEKLKEAEQMKKDQYLLNTYSSVQEINQIKQYELDQIDRAIQNDRSNIANMKERKSQLEKEIKNNSKPNAKSGYEEDLNKLQDMLAKTETSLDRNKKMYSEREQKYNNEKERFTAVLNMINKEKAEREKSTQAVNKEVKE